MSGDELRIIPRESTDDERRRLKSITARAVKMAGGAEFEPHTRVKKAALSKYGGRAEPDHFVPLDIILELDRHNGAPMITGVLARMQGFELRPIRAEEEDDLHLGDAQAIAKETGDVVNLLLGLLTSGKRLDATDRSDLLREVTEAKAVLYRLSAKLGDAR